LWRLSRSTRHSSASSAHSLPEIEECTYSFLVIRGLTVCGCSLFGPRSLRNSCIGDEGAQHIGVALKINKALTTLECALAAPQLPIALALLSAGGR
jgi:hypothetical protein